MPHAIRIRARNFDHALDGIRVAAGHLVRSASASNKTFLAAAWGLARQIAPVASQAAAFLFHPAFLTIHGKKVGFPPATTSADDQLIWEYKYGPSIREGWEQYLLGEAAKACEAVSEKVDWRTPERRWIAQGLLQVEYLGSPPAEIGKDAAWTHVGAYHAFHMRRLPDFAKALSPLPQRGFWPAFLGWHADTDQDAQLRRLVSNRLVKDGYRKCAILMLWTRSAYAPSSLLKLTQRYRNLYSRSVLFKGSPELPMVVLQQEKTPEKLLQELVEAVQSGHKGKIKEAAESLYGAKCLPPSLEKTIDLICQDGLRALVHGAKEGTRIAAAHVLAAFTRKTKDQWDVWNDAGDDALASALGNEIDTWRADPANHGTHLKSLIGKTIIAREVQIWRESSLRTLNRLAEPDFKPGLPAFSWKDPIIATMDIPPAKGQQPLLSLLRERLRRSVDLGLDLQIPKSPDWGGTHQDLLQGFACKVGGKVSWFIRWEKEDVWHHLMFPAKHFCLSVLFDALKHAVHESGNRYKVDHVRLLRKFWRWQHEVYNTSLAQDADLAKQSQPSHKYRPRKPGKQSRGVLRKALDAIRKSLERGTAELRDLMHSKGTIPTFMSQPWQIEGDAVWTLVTPERIRLENSLPDRNSLKSKRRGKMRD